MTSNIGSEYILHTEDAAERHRLVTDALKGHFRPEFLNRIDETIIFDRLSEEDYDPAYGARPLKRVIQKQVLDTLSLDLLDGKFADGDTIVVDLSEGKLKLR